MNEPTNADLFALLENQTDAFKQHAKDDQDVARTQGDVNTKQGETNMAIQETLLRMEQSLTKIEKKVDPLVEFWDSSIVMKKFFGGLGGVIVGVLGVGAAVMWVLNHFFVK